MKKIMLMSLIVSLFLVGCDNSSSENKESVADEGQIAKNHAELVQVMIDRQFASRDPTYEYDITLLEFVEGSIEYNDAGQITKSIPFHLIYKNKEGVIRKIDVSRRTRLFCYGSDIFNGNSMYYPLEEICNKVPWILFESSGFEGMDGKLIRGYCPESNPVCQKMIAHGKTEE